MSAASPRQQLDALSQIANLVSHKAAAATTAALASNTYANGNSGQGATLTATANGAIAAVDSYTPTLGDVLLVKNEATGNHNGLYKVTAVGDGSNPYVLTRSADAETTGMFVGTFVFIVNGTTNGLQFFVCSNTTAPTLGTTTISYSKFSPTPNRQHDQFVGTGAQTAFTLAQTPSGGLAALEVFVNGQLKGETDEYTLSGTTLTFLLAPPAPVDGMTNNIDVFYPF